jgi:hypothetical protein
MLSKTRWWICVVVDPTIGVNQEAFRCGHQAFVRSLNDTFTLVR